MLFAFYRSIESLNAEIHPLDKLLSRHRLNVGEQFRRTPEVAVVQETPLGEILIDSIPLTVVDGQTSSLDCIPYFLSAVVFPIRILKGKIEVIALEYF